MSAPDHTALLARFRPITLAEMDDVKLQDRVDTKYVFAEAHLEEVLAALTPHYRLLEVDGARGTRYRSLYYDTPERASYRDHHNGRPLRSKVRFREYVGSGLCFLEVKRKTGRGRTDKVRLRCEAIPQALTPEQDAFVRASAHIPGPLQPVLWNRFTRLTLVRDDAPERLTIDIGLTFSAAGQGAMEAALEGICVAELKQERADRTSPFARIMRDMHYRPAGMSKYCIGLLLLEPGHKHNLFNEVLRRLARTRQAA